MKDVTKLSGYDPIGEYQADFLDRGLKGRYRHQYCFDISEKELEEKMKGYSLGHNLTNDEKVSEFDEIVLGSNGSMIVV